jgi:hypothetical protein
MSMSIEMVHVGFGNILAISRVIAMASPNSSGISTASKRTIQEARNKGLLIDMTNGRRTKAVIFADSSHIVLSALTPETITGRLQTGHGTSMLNLEQSDDRVNL